MSHTKKYIVAFPGYFYLSIITAVLYCTMGTLFSLIIGGIVDAANHGLSNLVYMTLNGVLYVVLYVIATIIYGKLKCSLIGKSREALKNDLFKAVIEDAPIANDFSLNTAEYITDLTNNISIFETSYIKNVYLIVTTIAMFVSASVVTIIVEPLMLLIMVFLAVVTAFTSAKVGKPVEKRTNEFIKSQSDYVAELKDDFSAFHLIKTFYISNRIISKHKNKNYIVEKKKISIGIWQVLCQTVGQFVGLISTVIVMAVATYFVIKGHFSVGMIIAFGNLIGQIVSPITSIPEIIANIAVSRPIVSRFKSILAAESVDGEETKTEFKSRLELKNVSFSYNEKEILRDITFTVEKGKKYALIGNNGSGKTTLIRIMTGLIRDYKGEVLYDDLALPCISRESVSKLVSVVSQDVFLFNDTVRNNVTLFDQSYSEKQIKRALAEAGLLEIVESLPNGLDTIVEENGKNFSGGEKQRISLARAFLLKRPILILDEGTSAIDSISGANIEDELLRDSELTLVLITHDVSAEHLRLFDAVLSLDK